MGKTLVIAEKPSVGKDLSKVADLCISLADEPGRRVAALRGLAQSAARELAPKGIHVAHFVIDGGVRSAARPDPAERPDSTLDPDAIAQTYLSVLAQPRSAWTWEVELRPWVETF